MRRSLASAPVLQGATAAGGNPSTSMKHMKESSEITDHIVSSGQNYNQ